MDNVDLTAYDVDYDDAEVDSGGEYDDIPDGKYEVHIDAVELTESKAGNPMMKWTLKIDGPKLAGRLIWKYSMISSIGMQYLKKEILTCGLKLEKFSDLGGRLEELLDVKLNITVKTNGDFQNVYFDSIVDGLGAATEDDVPF
jgi:hypothetical protein